MKVPRRSKRQTNLWISAN